MRETWYVMRLGPVGDARASAVFTTERGAERDAAWMAAVAEQVGAPFRYEVWSRARYRAWRASLGRRSA